MWLFEFPLVLRVERVLFHKTNTTYAVAIGFGCLMVGFISYPVSELSGDML